MSLLIACGPEPWRVESDHALGGSVYVLLDEDLYEDARASLVMEDASGRVRWRRSVKSDWAVRGAQVRVIEDRVLVRSETRLAGFDAWTGAQRFDVPALAPAFSEEYDIDYVPGVWVSRLDTRMRVRALLDGRLLFDALMPEPVREIRARSDGWWEVDGADFHLATGTVLPLGDGPRCLVANMEIEVGRDGWLRLGSAFTDERKPLVQLGAVHALACAAGPRGLILALDRGFPYRRVRSLGANQNGSIGWDEVAFLRIDPFREEVIDLRAPGRYVMPLEGRPANTQEFLVADAACRHLRVAPLGAELRTLGALAWRPRRGVR